MAERQRDRVENYIRIGQDEGAKVAVGGGRPDGIDTGWFVEPTVFVDVDNSMRIAQEEIFGPVLSVIPYDDDADAVRIANDSDYGLCGAVFSGDNDRGLDVARQVRTGTYMVNSNIPIDFSSPFGGYKASGVGREFGEDGLELFLEKKTINLPAGYSPDGVSGIGRPRRPADRRWSSRPGRRPIEARSARPAICENERPDSSPDDAGATGGT